MFKQDGRWYLEPRDHIRVNQLAWPRLDKPGVRKWIAELEDEQIPTLVVEAHYFATQAGITTEVFQQALDSCPVATPEQVVKVLWTQSLTREYHDRVLAEAVQTSERSARLGFVWLTMTLFAVATATARAAGGAGSGWWTRDLHDPEVVKEVLEQEFGVSDA